ncbi:MAG TPA: TIM-barrel domain-containing protein, partial [Chitinophagaceae bacterium]|nr:TIM-barrel domain-containing protein [Chitinophagaceae bacterium]
NLFPQRPFVLTRSGYAGVQRYAALWTGDNVSDEEHMLLGIRLLTSLGLSGVAFSGMDVGGFTENASVELFARWIQLGAFFPYFRSHTNINTNAAEPWNFGEEVTEIARNFIGLRYRLLPYIYSHFYAATQNGMPLMRSLAIDYTHDDKIFDSRFQNQFLMGASVLVLPFRGDASYGEAYFPKGKWYNLFHDKIQNGEEEKILKLHYSRLPVFIKESSIIPMQSLIQSTVEKPKEQLYLHIYKGEQNSYFVYYEDDGESYQYQNGDYYKRGMHYDAVEKKITLEDVKGEASSKFKELKLMFHGFKEQQISVNGESMELEGEFHSFIKPISHFDPHVEANPVIGTDVYTCTIKNVREKIIIRYTA